MKTHGYVWLPQADSKETEEELVQELRDAGCTRVWTERPPKTKPFKVTPREQMLEGLKAGDSVVVPELQRVAKSLKDLTEVVNQILETGANLRILRPAIDTTESEFSQYLNLFNWFDSETRKLRNIDGINKAKVQGKFGKEPKLKGYQVAGAVQAYARGNTMESIANKYFVSEATISRSLAPYKARMEELKGFIETKSKEGLGHQEIWWQAQEQIKMPLKHMRQVFYFWCGIDTEVLVRWREDQPNAWMKYGIHDRPGHNPLLDYFDKDEIEYIDR